MIAVNCFSASSYQKECISATARSNGLRCGHTRNWERNCAQLLSCFVVTAMLVIGESTRKASQANQQMKPNKSFHAPPRILP